jgi:hypothetical protein
MDMRFMLVSDEVNEDASNVANDEANDEASKRPSHGAARHAAYAVGAVTKTPGSMSECFFSCQFSVLWAEFDSTWQIRPVAQALILAVAHAAFSLHGCRRSNLGVLHHAELHRIACLSLMLHFADM